jgi:hypothetical protein
MCLSRDGQPYRKQRTHAGPAGQSARISGTGGYSRGICGVRIEG